MPARGLVVGFVDEAEAWAVDGGAVKTTLLEKAPAGKGEGHK